MSELPQGPRPQRSERRERRIYRGSIFWPLILVAIGVVLLLRNTGALTGDAWENLLSLWPVLLIAIGLDSLYRREGVAGAVFWIGLGVVFLLTNLGLFAWNVWELILNLWPILLIAIGLDIVLGRRSTWGAILAMIILVAVLAGALWFLGGAAPAGLALSGEEISQPLGGATRASLNLKPSAGSLNLDALSEGSSNLVDGVIRKRSGETIRQNYSLSQGKADFSLNSQGISFYSSGRGNTWDWRLKASPAIPLDIDAGLGAGGLTLDLSKLQISALKVSLGVGQASVSLPRKGHFQAEISGAIGEIIVVIPEGMQVRIDASTGLTAVEVPDSFRKEGNRYTTSGYDTAEDRIDLKVSMAIGKVTVRVSR